MGGIRESNKKSARFMKSKKPTEAASVLTALGLSAEEAGFVPGEATPTVFGAQPPLGRMKGNRNVENEYLMRQAELPDLVHLQVSINLLTFDQIKHMAVVDVKFKSDKEPGGINDPRMGSLGGDAQCLTCLSTTCAGHY